ncbi:hypothetical protein [Vulgatibacter incomptus]|uniref:Glycosyltransferase RgtA/B/C/D-like domain-containing protein n=1 Tax=Vulgatibacter incomptus TaxID=1391653 RepID=A0A0K1P9G0_9BACT|nr:hypothetical protein [Vulgatibacter incomptus]AKU90160.1 hypothetical protein AKJ08_0547 [Vulgatibacter incomptus]
MKRSLLLLAVGAASLVLLGFHGYRYLPFVADDSLISLRYAQRLFEGHGLTWTAGERVEGYSNLLWVLASAFLGLLGFDLILALRILGFAGMGATVAAAVWAFRTGGYRALVPAAGASLALALSGPIAVWAVGGLEQAFVAPLLAWALVLSFPVVDGRSDRVFPASVLLALLVLTRPDGALFPATIGLAILLCRGLGSLGAVLRLSLLPMAAFFAQLVFRLLYYGDWISNTARAKAAFSWEHFRAGVEYIGTGSLWLGGLTILALASTLALRTETSRKRAILVALPLVSWMAYVASVGGDIFPGRRHFAPIVVMFSLLAGEFLTWASGHRSMALRVGGAAAGALALATLGIAQWRDPENRRALHERWEWDGEVVGNLLGDAFRDREPLLAVDSAGCLPYFSGLPSLDMLGLNDGFLARNRPPDFGKGAIGHELGNGAYVLGRNPDLVVFCSPGGSHLPCFRSGKEMLRNPRFRREWSLVIFEGRSPSRFTSRIFVRREGGRIGVRRAEHRIVIPGYLFATTPTVAAVLDPFHRIGASIPAGESSRFELAVPAGSERVCADSSGPVDLAVDQGGVRLAAGPSPLDVSSQAGVVTLTVSNPGPGEVHLREITLTTKDHLVVSPTSAKRGSPTGVAVPLSAPADAR